MTGTKGASPEAIIRDIKRKTRRKFTAEEEIRIVLEGLRGEASISDLCRKEGIHPTMYYKWSKVFLITSSALLLDFVLMPEHGFSFPWTPIDQITISSSFLMITADAQVWPFSGQGASRRRREDALFRLLCSSGGANSRQI